MKELYILRDKIGEIYSERTKIIEIVARFILAYIVLSYLSNNMGYMELLSKGAVTLGLSAACAVLPLVALVVVSLIIIVLNLYSLSWILTGCVVVVILFMFIIYFRFTSDLIPVAILTPVALAMNVPYAIPIVCGLLVGPMAAVPMACGVIVYYLIDIINELAVVEGVGTLSVDGILADALGFSEAFLGCNDMIFYIVVLSVGLWVVTGVRRIHMNYAWKVAIGSGVVAMIIAASVTGSTLEYEYASGMLFFGCILAVIFGLIAEFLFLGVDYKQTEYLEFEDDEYYYCIKAIPRVKGMEKKLNNKKKKNERVRERRQELVEQEEEYTDQIIHEDDATAYDETAYGDKAYDETALGISEECDDVSGSTTVLDTEEIERELRNNAHTKSVKSGSNKKKHAKTNYKMLKDSVMKELRRK